MGEFSVKNEGSVIGVQQNANTINNAAVPGAADEAQLVAQLLSLWKQLDEAQRRGELPAGAAERAKAQIASAAKEAKEEQPRKESVRQHLEGAKVLIDGLTAAAGLAPAFAAAARALQSFLP